MHLLVILRRPKEASPSFLRLAELRWNAFVTDVS